MTDEKKYIQSAMKGLTVSLINLSPPLLFQILPVGSSCAIAYWDQHQSTSDLTCGQYSIWSSYHCYRIHLYSHFCKLLPGHLVINLVLYSFTSFCKLSTDSEFKLLYIQMKL
jgi:hypothetical protein